ncbi:MAG: TPM domain-containing protein, partial [Bacteroidota bacterium]
MEKFVASFKQQGIINDLADILNESEELMLKAQILKIEKETSSNYVICTINNLQGLEINKVAETLGEHWKTNKIIEDKRILILIAKEEQKASIIIGKDEKSLISNKEIQDIINKEMIPKLKAADYHLSLAKGIKEVQHRSNAQIKESSNANFWYMVVISFVLLIILFF